jgi:hypothetical protein
MNASEHRLAAVQQGDERAPERQARDERLGAVDRIQHPDEFGVDALIAEFLAHDAVPGKLPADPRAHQFLRPAIGDRDR